VRRRREKKKKKRENQSRKVFVDHDTNMHEGLNYSFGLDEGGEASA
jgi:hypothetical protein